jgi:hypothetical protein
LRIKFVCRLTPQFIELDHNRRRDRHQWTHDENYLLRALISLPIDPGIGFLRCLIVPGPNADTTQTYVAPHRQQLYIFADVPT